MWENIEELSNFVRMKKNVIKSGGWVKLCLNGFLNKSNKKSEKTYGSCQIMLEWIFYQRKKQKCDKNKGGGSKYVGMVFKAKQTTKMW